MADATWLADTTWMADAAWLAGGASPAETASTVKDTGERPSGLPHLRCLHQSTGHWPRRLGLPPGASDRAL